MRIAVRGLLKAPGFTIVAVLTLALGIGANTAIFSVVNAVLLKPLLAKDPERLVSVWQQRKDGVQATLAYQDFQDLRSESRSVDQLEVYVPATFTLRSADRPERVPGARVSAGWLAMFGVKPLLGRVFLDGEDRADAARVVVLREDVWRDRFGAERNLIGRTIRLDGEQATVVGVMPANFRFPSARTAVWAPLVPSQAQLDRGSHFLRGIARLRPEVRPDQARAELTMLTRRLAQQFPREAGNREGAIVKPLRDEITGGSERNLYVMLGAVAFVFLIACANVANLLLVRASTRQREIAIRRALGGTPRRLFQQFAAESLLLAAAGAGLGWLLAMWSIDLLVSLPAAGIPRAGEIAPDWRVLGFTVLISALAALCFAVVGILQSGTTPLHDALKEGARGSAGGARARIRAVLVAGEIAVALVLLAGAGLLLESFWRLAHVHPGFNPDRVLTLRVDLPAAKYRNTAPATAFWQPLAEKIAALPQVESVGAIDYLPIDNWGVNGDFQIEGHAPWPEGQSPVVEERTVGAEYFRALQIPLIQGRFFSASDSRTSPPVVIINQTMARQFWGNGNPVGRRIRFFSPEWVTIAGVAGDVRQSGTDTPPQPELFIPWTQAPPQRPPLGMTLVVRASADPTRLANAIRAQVQSLDPDQPVSDIRSLDEVLERYLGARRFTMLLLASFAAAALLLAALGIYGVMAFAVRQRTQEIGIRLALGASVGNIFQVVMGQGARLAGAGILLGLAGAVALTRVLASLLFEVSATDAVTLCAVSVFLASIAALATYIPARRATKVDPMVALRYE